MEVAAKYGDKVEVKLYSAGKDVSYIKKYGMIFRGTMIINEKKMVTRLGRSNIEKEIEMAINEMGQ